MLRVLKFSVRDLWDDFVILLLLNVLWTLAALLPTAPLLIIREMSLAGTVAASLSLALPLAMVSGALCYVTNQVARGRTAGWSTFVTGLRRYWAKSLAVAGLNALALVIILANLNFYAVILQGTWTNIAIGFWVLLSIYWLLVQIYWFPMILELESEKIFEGLRHAFALTVIAPGFSLAVGAILLGLTILCILLTIPSMIIMAALLLLVANHATRCRLAAIQKEPYRPGEIKK
ncbi:MAG: hypothetical protein PVG11_03055 [Anaerolineae bacterium]